MAVYDILPSQNLEFSDVRDTLAASGGSVNNEMSSLFKTSSGINKWSKNKPVPFAQPFTEGYSDWYKGTGGLCGFDKNSMEPNTYNTVIDYYRKNDFWKYQPPAGGSSEPYRLGDFRGYARNAQPFIKTEVQKSKKYKVNKNATKELTFYFAKSTANNIQLSDFNRAGWVQDVNSIRVAAIICRGHDVASSSTIVSFVAAVKGDLVSASRPSITINIDGISTGNYTAVFCMVVPLSTERYIPLPFSGDTNYHSANITIVDAAFLDVNFRMDSIQFTGSQNTFPKTSIREINQQNPLILEQRGILKLYVNAIGMEDSSSFTISSALAFRLQIDGVNTGTQVKVLEIDGKTPTFPYKHSGGGTVQLVIGTSTVFDQILVNTESGQKTFNLILKNKSVYLAGLYTTVK